MTRQSIAALALCLLGFMAACAPQSPHTKSGGVTLNRGNGSEPDTLDPQKAQLYSSGNVILDMFEGLMTNAADGSVAYGAAESGTTSVDGLVWTFRLRDNHWSDGAPVTADDFVFSFRRLLDAKTASVYVSYLFPIKNAQSVYEGKLPPSALGIKSLDAKTLEINLGHPAPYLPQLLTSYGLAPVPKHLVETYGDAWVQAAHIATNGAYTLAEWQPNAFVRLVKNPHYYDAKKVQIETIMYYPLSDTSVELKRYRAGELDFTDSIPTREISGLKAEFGAALHMGTWAGSRYLTFNLQRKPFDDARVREALSLAIDRETIAGSLLAAGQIAAYSFVPAGVANYPASAAVKFKSLSMAERRQRAAALLAQAGYGPDHPLHLALRYYEGSDFNRVAIAVQGMWKMLGVDAELLNADKAVHFNALRVRDFDAAFDSFSADYDDPQNFLLAYESTSADLNYQRYNNPAYDALMKRASELADTVKRAAVLRQAEQTLLDDHVMAPLFFDASHRLVRPNIKGFEDNLMNTHLTREMRIDR